LTLGRRNILIHYFSSVRLGKSIIITNQTPDVRLWRLAAFQCFRPLKADGRWCLHSLLLDFPTHRCWLIPGNEKRHQGADRGLGWHCLDRGQRQPLRQPRGRSFRKKLLGNWPIKYCLYWTNYYWENLIFWGKKITEGLGPQWLPLRNSKYR
jgi:hypothetical protein